MGGSGGHFGSWEAGVVHGGVTGQVSALLVRAQCERWLWGAGHGHRAVWGPPGTVCNLLVGMEPDKPACEVKADRYQ